MLVNHLRAAGHATKLYSYTRQYPAWLYPGNTDKDPSTTPLRADCEYILDPINPLTWWRLCRKLRNDAPDVIVLQWWVPYWTPCLTWMTRWLKKHTRAKIVYICHNVMPHDGGSIDRRLAYTVLYRGDAFVVHSEQDRHQLHAIVPWARIFKSYMPSYADLAATAPAAPDPVLQTLPTDRPILLFFGLVRPYKGLEYLIQALPQVLAQRPVHLLAAGEFWTPLNFYERYADEYGVRHAITFVDRYVPNEALAPFFERAAVVVLPYISATQSGVVQLAFGFHKPVITTRVGGLHEVVHDGETGLVVPPQDETALARAILRYLNDDLGPAMTRNVQAQSQDFSWTQLVQILEQTASDA